MPTLEHEIPIEIVRERPELVAMMLRLLAGLSVPEHEEARLDSETLNNLAPTEWRADAVVGLINDGRPVMSVVLESQRSPNPKKRRSWPVYVTTVFARHGCPVALLVVCPDERVARWAAKPIHCGVPDMVLRPVVLGPQGIPVVTDPGEVAGNPELAVLSALFHHTHPEHTKIFQSLLRGLLDIDPDNAARYADLVFAALPPAARAELEGLMTTTANPYKSDFARRYFSMGEAKGEAKGEARAVLEVLAARGVDVPAATRERIMNTTDLEQLDIWLRRAATARTVDELFT